ncbi:MAG TPA: SRPBCC domain-containing protein [Nitrososphaera sp.]|nr:SRPBCC domain-containing protein [Nitrososphaera sp.]
MKELRKEIEINASAIRVWNILIDFGKYEQWNPFIHKITGGAKVGNQIQIHLRTPGSKNRTYEPTVTMLEQGRELRWLGKSFLLNGEHIFFIEELEPERVRFVQREIFNGFLTSFFGRGTEEDISSGFDEMNRALKARAERAQT